MENRRYKAAIQAYRTLLACVLFAVFLATACQEPTEPETLTLPVDIAFRVADQAGQGLEQAEVYFSVINGTDTTSFAFAGVSNGEGLVFIPNQPVPLEGADYRFQINPPPGFSTVEPLLYGPERVPCRDTAYEVRLSRQEVIECNTIYSDNIEFLLCLEDNDSERFCTPFLTHDCPNPITLTIGDITPPVESLLFRVRDGNGSPLSLPATLAAGERFQLCFEFSPTDPISAAAGLRFSGTDGMGNRIDGSIDIVAEAQNCRECECPDDLAVRYPESGNDTVCVGESKTIEIPLDLSNLSEEGCSYFFELQTDFSGGDLAILSFNGGSKFNGSLPSGRSLRPLEVLYTPSGRGVYRDQAEYRVRARNAEGEDIDCEARLTIEFNGFGGVPLCVVVLDPSDTTLVTTDSTFYQCVNQDEDAQAKVLRLENRGECPLELEAVLDGNSVFQVAPPNLEIPPGESGEFEIRFVPRDDNVWPAGRGNSGPGIVEFSDLFTLTGCEIPPVNLAGVTDTLCSFVTNICLHRYGEQGGTYAEGVQILEDNQLLFVNQADTTTIDFFVRAIDVSGANAILTSQSGVEFKIVDNRSLAPNEVTCDFRDQYFAECDDDTGFSPTLNNASANDIIIFRRDNFCGILWISKIDLDRTDPADALPQVCFQICYPL